MRKAIHTAALALALAVSTYGGVMQFPAEGEMQCPTPTEPCTTQEPTTEGEIPNNLTGLALTVLSGVLPLL